MSHSFSPLVPAQLSFDAAGTPFSQQYQDVYHARQGALAQARHVFMQGNGLPGRWRGRDAFTVCETGFGLGRNFLALWREWRADPGRCARLHMMSFEAHPFSANDLSLANAGLPDEAAPLARQLVQAWPPLLPGIHRLEFEGGALTLTLVFGRVERTAFQARACVDAFFLDGFAPRSNPEMWSPELFGQLVRMAAPGATAATWCASGEVRRALRNAGFLVRKAPGLGGKWAMTTATLRPGLGRGAGGQADGPVLVVGAGPAGAGIAHSLAQRGREVIVADPALALGLGASHRGHLAAALTPLLSRDDDVRARLSRAGVLRAARRWQGLPAEARPLRCGTIELAQDARRAQERRQTLEALRFPSEWVSWLEPAEASARLGLAVSRPGVWFADGRLARPEPLLQALLDHPRIRCAPLRISRLAPDAGGGWLAHAEQGGAVAAPMVVLANAFHARALLETCAGVAVPSRLAGMRRLAGQVGYFDAQAGRDPACILGGAGYWLPSVEGVNVGGSTYVRDALFSCVTEEGHREVAGKVGALLGRGVDEVAAWRGGRGGWAGWRAAAAGRLPLAGPVAGAPGLWLACAYGSRGLSWSALVGDMLAAELLGEPQPLERDLARALTPR